MSIEENKTLIQTFLDELYNQGNLLQADDVILSPLLRGALKRTAVFARTRLAGFCFVIEDLIAEEDQVVARCALRGTYIRRWLGLALVQRPIDAGYIAVYRLSDGRVKSFWFLSDVASLLPQLGPLGALLFLIDMRTP